MDLLTFSAISNKVCSPSQKLMISKINFTSAFEFLDIID